jgi:MoaA/NifB/PqqE/SkfB family radical SAM enzyme
MKPRPITPHAYYRLPWNLADNAITWLEPTTKCNIYCDGCYRENDPLGHKPLDQVIADLEQIKRMRKTDGISIAGGEPLIYPHIMELVRYVKSQGWKPIIITNGEILTTELVRELKEAGCVGFTVHIDSHQKRPSWRDATEKDLNELRLKVARMICEGGKGKIVCALNATIYRDTLKDVPLLARWAQDHMNIVDSLVYILYRSEKKGGDFDKFVRGEKIDTSRLVYQLDRMEEHDDVVTQEVVDLIRTVCPDYEPCAYLNGTADPSTSKWLLAVRTGNAREIIGYQDPKFIELVQAGYHLLKGNYLAYATPLLMRRAKLMLPLTLINKGVRRTFGRLLANPLRLFRPLHTQSIMIIQPPDFLSDGRANMCDGCPDGFYYKGRFVWKCRLDELEKFGDFVTAVPRKETSPSAKGGPETFARIGD